MEKFIRFGNVEVEIFSELQYFTYGRSWEESKDYLRDRELRLPTLKELEYIHNLLYLNQAGNFSEGSEYWTSENSDRRTEGSFLESHRTLIMNFRGTPSQKYNYVKMKFRGVRDV